ncbi:glycosyltransferase family 2 protein [Phocaeicola sp.]
MPKISIITINYNNSIGLEKTIRSVINQTYTNYEYIVIDGNSTDGSKEIIKKYDADINFWVSEPDKGIYNAMNKGILKSSGTYLIFMNSGDSFYNNTVLANVDSLLTTEIVLGQDMRLGQVHAYNKDTVSILDLWKTPLNHQSAFIHRKLFANGSLYDEDYKMLADQKHFVYSLIIKNCTFKNIDLIIVDYDISGLSANNHQLFIEEKEKIYKDLLPQRVIDDFLRYAKADSPIIDLLPSFNRTYRFHRMVYNLVKILIKLRGPQKKK